MKIFQHDSGEKDDGVGAATDHRTFGETQFASLRSVLVRPGQSSKYHAHASEEEFHIIVSGVAVTVGGDGIPHEVGAGSLVYFALDELHATGCVSSASEPVHFLSLTTPNQNKVRTADLPEKFEQKLKS